MLNPTINTRGAVTNTASVWALLHIHTDPYYSANRLNRLHQTRCCQRYSRMIIVYQRK